MFYTVLPNLSWIKPRFQRIARFAPLIGILLGAIQGSFWHLFSQMSWSKEASALATVGVGIWLTGGLHLDGLMDTADGLAAGKNKCKEAMRDSRIGASAIQAFTIVLLFQLAAIIKLNSFTPLAIPIAMFWGRCAPLWAIEKFSYLHQLHTETLHVLN